MKKAISLCMAVIMLFTFPTALFAYAWEDSGDTGTTHTDISEDVLDRYLAEAGYSESFIGDLDLALKQKLYDGQYQYESSATTYGIFTENYRVEYTLGEAGEIVIDAENRDELNQLMNDTEALSRVLACNSSDADLASSVTSAQVDAVRSLPEEAAIESLSNWHATMTCSQKSYKSGVVTKHLIYSWKWFYAPVWTLTDKVAMAWSGNFTAEPDTIYYTYNRKIGYTGSSLEKTIVEASGYDYDDYDCNAGCAKEIDIKAPTSGTYIKYHSGILAADIVKATRTNSYESAVGRYYHTRLNPGLSLTFSNVGPTIGVAFATSSYDQSSDSAVAFWTIES